MRKAIQRLQDICSGQNYCTDCPFFDHDADALDEACTIASPPDTWDVDKIADILERLS